MSVDHDLSAIAQIDEQDYSPRHEKKHNRNISDRNLDLDEVDINLEDFDDMDQREDLDKLNVVDNDLINNYDDFADTLNKDIDYKDNMTQIKKKDSNNLTIDINNSNYKELGDIFEKIEEFDSFFGTISPKMRAQESPKANIQLAQ